VGGKYFDGVKEIESSLDSYDRKKQTELCEGTKNLSKKKVIYVMLSINSVKIEDCILLLMRKIKKSC